MRKAADGSIVKSQYVITFWKSVLIRRGSECVEMNNFSKRALQFKVARDPVIYVSKLYFLCCDPKFLHELGFNWLHHTCSIVRSLRSVCYGWTTN